jgi:hypothetical protein
MATWLFYWHQQGDEMKKIGYAIAPCLFICIFLWIYIFPKPAWATGSASKSKTSPIKEPAKAIGIEKAVSLAKEYLKIEDTINYKIQIEERVITTDAFNTYKVLEAGTIRLCWVVTMIAPDTVGAGRTVYVDKESGDILGGYSSK